LKSYISNYLSKGNATRKTLLESRAKTRESTKKTRFQKLPPPMVGNQLEKEIQESQK
jgi:hypothetical protein